MPSDDYEYEEVPIYRRYLVRSPTSHTLILITCFYPLSSSNHFLLLSSFRCHVITFIYLLFYSSQDKLFFQYEHHQKLNFRPQLTLFSVSFQSYMLETGKGSSTGTGTGTSADSGSTTMSGYSGKQRGMMLRRRVGGCRRIERSGGVGRRRGVG